MHKIFKLILLIFTVFSCSKEEYFEFSSSANIIQIEFSGQSGSSRIDRANDSIYIEVANGMDLSTVRVVKLELSSFATSDVNIGDTIDFSDGFVAITVTSEDGTPKVWRVDVFESGSEPQLENSDFNLWYESSAGYLEIGESEESTIWGTSNPGVVFGGMEANVLREAIDDENSAIKMVTRYSTLAAILRKPIASGSAFTGVFNTSDIDINDPEAAIDFGTPFTATPDSFSLEYSYVAGENNIDKNGRPLGYPDSCDMYVILERRDADSISRVATAWYRTTGETEEIKELKMELVYGQLPIGTPEYMLPKSGEGYSVIGTKPTHIRVVFASSAHGNSFQGAEGSTLIVNNFLLYY